MKITSIRTTRLAVPLDPAFPAAWDPVPRTTFAVTLVRVETDEGVVGIGSGDTMDGFGAFEHLFVGQDPLAIARQVRALETIDVVAARRIAAQLAELDVLWVEEPLAGTDLAGLASLRRSAPGIRIAGGEMTRTFADGLAALDADAFDVYQPDVVLASGMLRTRTIAEVALARNRWFTPHTWTNGIGLLANLHVAAGVGGGPFLEFPYDPPGWTPERRDAFLVEPIRPGKDGVLRVPTTPGIGAGLDEDAIRRFAA